MMEQCFDLGERPRRRDRRIAMEAPQRFDAQVAIDQHESLGVADHDHRHLLPDLGDRTDQAPALLTIMDPQITMAKLELVEIDIHAATVLASPTTLHLVLRDAPTMSGYSRRDLDHLFAYLVLHEPITRTTPARITRPSTFISSCTTSHGTPVIGAGHSS